MADVIYKYGPIVDREITARGTPVHFGYHVDGELYLWNRVTIYTEDEPLDPELLYRLVGTGDPFVGPCYGSVVTPLGFVWHLVQWQGDPYVGYSW